MERNNEQQYQIFISYRRNGSDAHARVFYEKLKEIGYTVFLDFESLFSGGFKLNILKAIEECTDFVLLLPKDGLDRCQDEDDLLREANRILEEIGFSSAGKRKKRKGIRRGAWFALGALCGGGGVGLLGLLFFLLL